VKLSILGAGSIGLQLGAQLARAGFDPLLLVRREEVAVALRREGIHVIDPASGRRWRTSVRATADPRQAAPELSQGIVLLCVRAPDTRAASAALRAVAPGAHVVSAQNDVDNEEELASRFTRVSGLVVRQTATRAGPNVVRVMGCGRLVAGDHPEGACPQTRVLAGAFRQAGFDVGLSERIAEDKWLKLCVNLMTAVNALVRRCDHQTKAFVEVKTRLLEEARDALAAAGIRARSCDGRDRSLEEEIAHQRDALSRGTSARPIPLYNGVWTALRHGTMALEADLYHERILGLARQHGTDAPVNARVLGVLGEVWRERRGPESVSASTLLPA